MTTHRSVLGIKNSRRTEIVNGTGDWILVRGKNENKQQVGSSHQAYNLDQT